jgi:hypothetical protein
MFRYTVGTVMAKDANQNATEVIQKDGSEGWARLRAAWIVERWRRQGFDRVARAPSGYCSPLNSHITRMRLPEEYQFFDLDGDDAVEAIEASIKLGNSYRF